MEELLVELWAIDAKMYSTEKSISQNNHPRDRKRTIERIEKLVPILAKIGYQIVKK
jgi:hypothetical protein